MKLPRLKKLKDELKENKKVQKPLLPYDRREKVQKLALVVTIINRHQADYFLDTYREIGAALSMILYSYSMPPEEIRQLLGDSGTKKDIIMTICREEYVPEMLEKAKERFAISKVSKGIAFSCPIDSVSGIAAYKFLSDHNKIERTNENGK